MMNEKILAEEILLDDEMEKVSGGTVVELEQIVRTFFKNSDFKDSLGALSTHLPGASILTAEYNESFMSNEMGIDANISVGVGGTGIFSKKNTYRDIKTGKFISHDEVLKRIENHAA